MNPRGLLLATCRMQQALASCRVFQSVALRLMGAKGAEEDAAASGGDGRGSRCFRPTHTRSCNYRTRQGTGWYDAGRGFMASAYAHLLAADENQRKKPNNDLLN